MDDVALTMAGPFLFPGFEQGMGHPQIRASLNKIAAVLVKVH